MSEKKYSISEASKVLEVENHVLRYWEEELELMIPRNELGHRFYREEDIQTLRCIKELKNKGFQLRAVKEVLPDLKEKHLIDVHKLLATQEELERQEHLERETGSVSEVEPPEEPIAPSYLPDTAQPASIVPQPEKMAQFEQIMGRIVNRALQEQLDYYSEAIGSQVSGRILCEMDELAAEREAKEEERYRKLDEAIRSHQKSRQEIAVTRDDGPRKKSLFFKKNKRKI